MTAHLVLTLFMGLQATPAALTPPAALDLLKKDAATGPPVKQSVILATRCTIGGPTAVPPDFAALARRGLITVTQKPLDPAFIEQMGTDGVNQLRGWVPEACIETIRNRYAGMNGLVASGQRDFNVMEITITPAGRALGLGEGYAEVALLREEPEAVTRLVKVDENTWRVEYTVKPVMTEVGVKTGLAELYVKQQPGTTARARFLRRARNSWGVVP